MHRDHSPLLAALGQRVRALRKLRGATIAELAARARLSPRFVQELEAGTGNISVLRLAAVAEALGVPLERLAAEAEPAAADGSARSALAAELLVLGDAEVLDVLAFVQAKKQSAVAFEKCALIGLRGAGKTSIGQSVARRLRVPFVELDQRIEEVAGMRLADVFSIHGEPYYRRLEREVIQGLLAKKGRAVLAAGGGIVTSPETYALLRGSCFTVWLAASPDDHWNRVVQQGDQRPMKGKPQAMAELRAILAARAPLYAQAHRRVDTSALGLERSVDEVARLLRA